MDWSLFAPGATGWGDELLRGLGVTIALAVAAYLLGLVLGIAAGIAELSGPRLLRGPLSRYAAMLRSLPELLVIFFIYYGSGALLQLALSPFGLDLFLIPDAFTAGTIAIGLVQGAYTSEVVKGAILAVPRGLQEAAMSLGMPKRTAMVTVTLPLALRYAFPGLMNLWMVVIKTTPFVSAIGLGDFISAATTAGQNTKHYFAFYFAVLAVYLAISGASMVVQAWGERRLFRHIGVYAS